MTYRSLFMMVELETLGTMQDSAKMAIAVNIIFVSVLPIHLSHSQDLPIKPAQTQVCLHLHLHLQHLVPCFTTLAHQKTCCQGGGVI